MDHSWRVDFIFSAHSSR